MYNVNLRRLLKNSTVRDLKKVLANMPDDMELYCCGFNELWLHVDDKGNYCNFDCDELSEDY